MLVLSLDLEKVEEVCATGVDLNQVFVWTRLRSGKGGDGELFRARHIVRYLDGFHRGEERGEEEDIEGGVSGEPQW